MKGILTISMIILSVFILSSCEKGPQGEQGEDGNTNVKTTIVTVKPADWQGTTTIFAEKTMNIITNDIAEFGAVFVYQEIGDKMYKSLPYTWPDGNETVIYRFKTAPYLIKFEIHSEGTTTKPIDDRVYKVVAMEASEHNYAKRVGVNFNNYQQVKSFLESKSL